MKHLLQILFAVFLASLALAAPAKQLQTPLTGTHRHAVGGGSHHIPKKIKMPFVIKTSSAAAPPAAAAATVAGAADNNSGPVTVNTAAKAVARPLTPGLTPSSWITKWRGSGSWMAAAKTSLQAGAPLSCFCAGASICCRTADGLNCNAGYCGI
ncbi:hypothetical protein SPI_08344 [Niveomyces insectorum RCEF 264]|uniref:Uncharacterized protein n=1 Tax=Niveomyces insectorum RCEF 264 TaxID=1081102 RepID=A0A167N8B1_9HYPO|nr:hypothetical protein SPI_08344 [Niveomyces insectorum RCEF 264]